MLTMIIREYRQNDRTAVEHIRFETYFLGKSGSLLVDNPKIFTKDIAYYLDKEPESCFVAEEKGKIVGYLLGCLDDKNHNESISAFLGKSIRKLFQLPLMSSKDRKFWWSKIKVIFLAISGKSDDAKFKTPKDSGHIHIIFFLRHEER